MVYIYIYILLISIIIITLTNNPHIFLIYIYIYIYCIIILYNDAINSKSSLSLFFLLNPYHVNNLFFLFIIKNK
ncbi:MAG: hypothetical protein N7Q72_02235, partial [Spiroplasma sp. Tabriz.8]|nr:hypothetical protein [Spiroplasma sp. Tabriz.8]